MEWSIIDKLPMRRDWLTYQYISIIINAEEQSDDSNEADTLDKCPTSSGVLKLSLTLTPTPTLILILVKHPDPCSSLTLTLHHH